MFHDILSEMKEANLNIAEMVRDKRLLGKCHLLLPLPEGTITYCSNHCIKIMHADLQKAKQLKCKVST